MLASAASRAQGLAVFLVGLLPLAAGLVAFRRGRRSALYGVVYGALLLAVAALGFEAVLHVAPGTLSGRVANVAYTGYHWQRGGIYRLDPEVGPDLVPDVRRPTYWQGHWWLHETNRDGYRGPSLARADAVFLGDSMVYGHGVETGETVPARWAARTGLAAANLGQQGTCLVQALVILKRKGLRLAPRTVFLCSHVTDMEEATRYYAPEELRRFVDSRVGAGYLPRVRPEYRPPPPWDPFALWSNRVALPMRSSGILGALYRSWRERGAGRAASRPRPFVPAPASLDEPFAPSRPDAPALERLRWDVHRRAAREVKHEADALGARLVLFDIGYPRAFSAAVEALAAELEAAYAPVGREILGRALAGEEVYLADDGHWTPRGCDAMAEGLARVSPGAAGR